MRITIGTRKSKLALVQTDIVVKQLLEINPALDIHILPITTTGDKITDQNLYDIGGKALFLKEIEEHMLAGKVDIAVHSLKDVPGILPEGLKIAAVLEREDPRDVFVSSKCQGINSLVQGAIVGSSSVRRQVILHKIRPDLKFVQFRGNVPTRVDKVMRNEVDATILAAAGLKRLNIFDNIFCKAIDPNVMLPAAGQGIIAIEAREDDHKILELLTKINHLPTWYVANAERSFLSYLDASCRTPISAYAVIEYGRIKAKYMLSDIDGANIKYHTEIGAIEDAASLGVFAAQKMGI